ncbi:extensin family protein [Wenxinia marina]|uniref:Extensin-like C-terminal domain-containing protein n=1 Tax=Wenxinia marina DSM 24838 TaxID=1123501 RepID=A0A0D0P8Z3_9RHOB|nr:extensin family protein [Wenxinia marina]KIQ68046.1 hypothetical protein Wenmar_03502 [Wenxinia marina DSM 24838]GGL75132.1 hypothetical protein GCM10011392_32230 [Wenxinia marina]
MRLLPLLLAAALSAGPALAQTAPLRPEARPLPEAPGRPLVRPDLASVAPSAPARPAVRPASDPDTPRGNDSPVLTALPRDATDTAGIERLADLPVVAAAAPLVPQLGDTVSTSNTHRLPLDEAMRLARADREMQPPLVNLLPSWDGATAPVRPGYIAVAAVQPMALPPLRPSLRPHQPWMDVVATPVPVPGEGPPVAEEGDLGDPGYSIYAVALAIRPPERPPEITQEATRVAAERARGQVCGTPELQGDTLGHVGGPGSCGIDGAVRVRSVAGIPLSLPARMDCATARSLLAWVQTGAIPAIGSTGGGLRELHIVGEYACRGRNNQAGARLSEHSFGRAIDIAGFRLRDGTEVSVLRGWNSSHGRMLRAMWRAACGPFGTVLGPNANAAHRDHFHFDTARYRSGSYCR